MNNSIFIENNGKQALVIATSFILPGSVYNTLSMTRVCTFTSTEGHAWLPLYTTFARGFAVLHCQIQVLVYPVKLWVMLLCSIPCITEQSQP